MAVKGTDGDDGDGDGDGDGGDDDDDGDGWWIRWMWMVGTAGGKCEREVLCGELLRYWGTVTIPYYYSAK